MAANEVCITEYADILQTVRGAAQCPQDPPLAVQILALSASHVESAAFNAATRYINITVSGVDARIVNNTAAPVADVATSERLIAGNTYSRGVTLGAGNKISIVAAT